MDSKFITKSTITYDVATDGTTTITYDVTLQNKTSSFYATSYSVSLDGISPQNPAAYEQNLTLPVKTTQKDNSTTLEVNFPDEVVGIDAVRQFSLVFKDRSLVHKTGEIWEITTPKLADINSLDYLSTVVKVPTVFGNLAYISPNPTAKTQEGDKTSYIFNQNANSTGTITAAFGNFQVFTFNLTYHLENPLGQNATTQIALPPDTNYQKMNYTSITPKPVNVEVDANGNWLADYNLKPNEKIDVHAQGAVQIFAAPLTNPKTNYEYVTQNLQKGEYWQTDDPQIQALAKQLKTPQAIYNYVTHYLSYNYTKAAPDIKRMGAVAALAQPKNAICTEFTDLFVAIARAAGIPAREVEGFAYTDNPQIQPLSLVADVLHAWPQYWDDTKQSWIPVDPTWEETSGIDYFTKLDLRHFTFVIHGTDPKKPYPAGSYKSGTNPQKDINISFGQLPVLRASNLVIQNNVVSQLPFANEIVATKVTNTGSIAAYNQSLQVKFDNNLTKTNLTIAALPPYAT